MKLIGLKVLDKNGKGTTSNVINAITFATANKAALGIDVINLSLGHPIFEPAATDPLVQAVERAVQAGIVVVASAGNFGTNPDTRPGRMRRHHVARERAIRRSRWAPPTFGTIDRSDDAVAPYSLRGRPGTTGSPSPIIVAPGDRIVADYQQRNAVRDLTQLRVPAPRRRVRACTCRLTGSSMAAAVVTGVVATSARREPLDPRSQLDADGEAQSLRGEGAPQYTATHLANTDALAQGAGEVNAAGAIALMRALDTGVEPWTIGAVTPSTTFGGRSQVWSTNIVWGTSFCSRTTTSSGARAFSSTTTSSGARAISQRTTTSCGARTCSTTTTSSGARAVSGTTTSCGVLGRRQHRLGHEP
mgnify:CR=1 FL=1